METPASNAQTINVKTGGGSTVILATAQDKSTASIHQRGVEVDQILPLLDKLLTATKQEPIAPTALRREVRDLQTEIEENNAVPSDLVTRLTNSIPATITLSDNTTTILNNIRQLWQHAFGGGV